MDEMNKIPEVKNNEEVKAQGIIAPESNPVATPPAPKAPIPKLPLIIGGAIAAVSAIVVILVIVFGGSHKHSYGDWNIVDEPTCLAAGIEERVCDCGEKEMRRTDALGHTEVIDEKVEATCTESGLTEGKHCSTCNTVIVAQKDVAQLTHKYSSDSDIDCNYCGEVRYDNCTHTETVVVTGKAATCTATGLTDGKKCKTCGKTIEAQQEIPVVDHTYDDKYDETCNKCDFVREAECAHRETETIIGYAATCTAPGLTDGSKCKKCGETVVSQQTITALDHKYNDGVVVSTATCTTQGIKRYTCTASGCSHSYTDTYSLPTFTATEVSNQAIKYVGEITTYDKNGRALATGTGFVMSSNGKIITNYHVIEGAYSAEIIINSTKYTIASVLAYDADIDLAVLKVNATGLTAATICKSLVNVGETVYAVGSSRGLTNTFSQGIVTYANRVVDGVSHVQHDASITHGNSGGPLINIYGEVIGINTWGISDSQNLNFAVASSELDNLVYLGTPISLSEFYDLNNQPYDVLLDWLIDNYNANDETDIRYDYYGDSTWYSLGYDIENDCLYIDVLWEFDDGARGYFYVEFSGDSSNYYYYAAYEDDGYSNTTRGYINAKTFTESTPLTYYSYDGTHWNQQTLLSFYQSIVVNLLDWFDWATYYYDMGVTIKDMGFEIFEVTEDEVSGLDILINHIISVGEYDSNYQWYEIRKSYYYSNYDCYFGLVYNLDNDNVFVSMSWFGSDGTTYYAYLSLVPSSRGVYYSCTYSEKNNGSYTDLNDTWGYINPSTFTDNTSLSYVEYNGLPEYEIYLLDIYAGCIQDSLDWLIIYLNTNDVDITISDLGFLAY